MAQAYENAVNKLPLTQHIIRLTHVYKIRLTHVYKSMVSNLLMSF